MFLFAFAYLFIQDTNLKKLKNSSILNGLTLKKLGVKKNKIEETAKKYQKEIKGIFEQHISNLNKIRQNIEEKNDFLKKEKKYILDKQGLKNQVLINKNQNFYQKISDQEEEKIIKIKEKMIETNKFDSEENK